MDGYFSSYPANSTILLRRNANGQPAMIIYPYGNGYVVATSLYTDFAYSHSQANQEEINLVRNIISWAKKPAALLEIKPGQTANLTVNVANYMDTNASSVKMTVLSPSGTVVKEDVQSMALSAGQLSSISYVFASQANTALGIYRIDYTLLDGQGNILQAEAETDSGRFAVSNPSMQVISKPLSFSVTAPTENFMYGSNATFTWTIWNNSDTEKTVTLRYGFPHHTWETGDQSYGNFNNLTKTITVPAKDKASFTHTITIRTEDQLFSYLYDNNNQFVGQSNFKIWRSYPSANISAATNKSIYAKGETVTINTDLKNNISNDWPADIKVTVSSPGNNKLLEETRTVSLSPGGRTSIASSFQLPSDGDIGTYTVRTEVWSGSYRVAVNSAQFTLPVSQIVVTPGVPSSLNAGTNTFTYTIANSGKIKVHSGVLALDLYDPDGEIVSTTSREFALDVGQTMSLDMQLNAPSLKFGNYAISVTQSDETKTGNSATTIMANSAIMVAALDKSSYLVREMVNLTVTPENTGKFNVGNATLTVQVPDTAYSDSRQITLPVGTRGNFLYPVPLPSTLAAGQHRINISLGLPSGSSITRNAWITVPESSLKISYVGPSSLKAGDTITLNLENSGGVDANADVSYALWRSGDANGLSVAQNDSSINIQAGGSLPILITIPPQAVQGTYDLFASAYNAQNDRTSAVDKSLEIEGIMAGLSVNTDRPMFHSTENINTTSSILNHDYPINGGNLHMEIVNQCNNPEIVAMIASLTTSTEGNFVPMAVSHGCSEHTFWVWDTPINQATSMKLDFSNIVAPLPANQYILKGELKSSTGQTISTAAYPFTVIDGDYGLLITTDKQYYRPGETITIKGEADNFTEIDSSGVSLYLNSAGWGDSLENFTIPAKGKYGFSLTTTAGSVGKYTLDGEIDQNDSSLFTAFAKYSVADPELYLYTDAVSIADHNPFDLNVYLSNDGNVPATVDVKVSGGSLQETRTITLQPGEFWDYNFSQTITSDTDYTIQVTGDLTETQTVSVKYGEGLAASIQPNPLYPEGKVSIPLVVNNTGLLDRQFTLSYQLVSGGNPITQMQQTYSVAKGATVTDLLNFDLNEGNYQLTVQSVQPVINATVPFQVRKIGKTDFTLSVGTQTDIMLPVNIAVTNLGFDQFNGSLRVSLIDNQGGTSWSSIQGITLPQSQSPGPQAVPFSIDLSTATPGNYTITGELLDNGNRQIKAQSTPLTVQGPIFNITKLPDYQTVAAGSVTTMTFKVKNNGNQEGQFDLSLKADDLIDTTRSTWLKPGEETEVAFTFGTAADLEEKDYSAVYRLKTHGTTISEGAIAYHLAGVKITVNATLDKQSYSEGETANLTLTLTQPEGGAVLNLFARVNYNGFEDKQDFSLDGSQTLTFKVPLSQITGEKLFYGVYLQSGRAIHLNSVYIYKNDSLLTVNTDRQVYNPGDTVTVTAYGTAAGTLSLSGQGNFSDYFAFSGSASRSFALPLTMTSGTYSVAYTLTDATGNTISGSTPFDVSGTLVKVKEALLDKDRYAPGESLRLALTIESNRAATASIKTWIVEPSGHYVASKESPINLSSSSPLLLNLDSQLSTSSLGIHKVVYGVYQDGILLVSGAKAFEVGETVILGLSTDRVDYADVTSSVSVKVDLYGTSDANLELFLDGTSIKSGVVTLAGFTSFNHVIPVANLTPGKHTVRTVLSAAGLTSAKETTFSYGSNLPDLLVRLNDNGMNGNSFNLNVVVINQGQTGSESTTVALYDGDPAQGGSYIDSLNVPPLAPGAATTLAYAWNALGKAGGHKIYALVDPSNLVTEFNKTNNKAFVSISLPSLTLGISLGRTSFQANTDVAITTAYANLSNSSAYQNLLLRVDLTDPLGLTSNLKEATIATLSPATEATSVTIWNTARNLPGNYAVSTKLISGGSMLASSSSSFTINPSVSVTGSMTLNSSQIQPGVPLDVEFNLTNSGNVATSGVVKAMIIDQDTNAIKDTKEQQIDLPLNASQAGQLILASSGLDMKSYLVELQYLSQENSINVASTTFTVKDGIPPVLTVSTLADGSYTNNGILNISGKVTDNIGVKDLRINGVIEPINSDGSFSYALVLKSGANTVTTVATDLAGNQETDTRTITLDLTAPLLVVTIPADNTKTSSAILTVSGNVDETSTVTVKLGNSVLNAAMSGNSFTSTVNLVAGYNTVEITATDLAGNQSSQKRTVLFDDQKPSVAITDPNQDIHTNKSSLTIRGTASDPLSSVVVTIAMDGQTYRPAVVNGQFEQTVTFTTEKTYAIVVTATNEVGTSATAQRNVIYDITPPALAINPVVSPTNQPGQALSGTMEEGAIVSISCATATIGVVTYPTTTTWSVNITNLTAGTNVITVKACDQEGNASTASVNIVYTVAQSIFNFAVFGNKSVNMTGGSYTDSYINTPPNIIRGQYKHGDVGTNSTQSCSIQISGGTLIYGKAWAGTGGNPAKVICASGGSSVYNNNTGSLPVAKDMTPKTDPGGGTSMGALNLSNGVSKSLSAGYYRYTSINLSGGSKLTLNGQITIHVDGNLIVSNGSNVVVNSGVATIYENGQKIDITGGAMVNNTKDPRNLVIYGAYALQTVNLSGGASIYALVYAPNANISISGGQNTYGAIIGNTVNISNGSSVHFDEILSQSY